MTINSIRRQTNIQDLPEDCITQVLVFSASAPICTEVCKSWCQAAHAAYPFIFEGYKLDPKIARFTPAIFGSFFEAVKQTYLTVITRTHPPHIQAGMASLDRLTPLVLHPILKIVEDANLLQFFGRLSKQIPRNEGPILKGDLAEQSAAIRNWMENHQTYLDRIINLDLALLGITTLPPEIGRLRQLGYLSVINNNLTILPQEIGQLKNLRYLQLCRNQLTVLPKEICLFVHLRRLSLSGNKLTTLPQEIGQLTNLRGLWLDNNQLTSLPPGLVLLGNLRELQLSHTSMLNLQEHPLQPGLIPDLCALDKLIGAFQEGKNSAALKIFEKLSKETKNAIYAELHSILSFKNNYHGCVEYAFSNLCGQDTTNVKRVKAIRNFIEGFGWKTIKRTRIK